MVVQNRQWSMHGSHANEEAFKVYPSTHTEQTPESLVCRQCSREWHVPSKSWNGFLARKAGIE